MDTCEVGWHFADFANSLSLLVCGGPILAAGCVAAVCLIVPCVAKWLPQSPFPVGQREGHATPCRSRHGKDPGPLPPLPSLISYRTRTLSLTAKSSSLFLLISLFLFICDEMHAGACISF